MFTFTLFEWCRENPIVHVIVHLNNTSHRKRANIYYIQLLIICILSSRIVCPLLNDVSFQRLTCNSLTLTFSVVQNLWKGKLYIITKSTPKAAINLHGEINHYSVFCKRNFETHYLYHMGMYSVCGWGIQWWG